MKELFKNTNELIKFKLKIEKIRIPIYIISMSAFLIVLLPVFENIINTSDDVTALIETMKNPAMISILGPVYESVPYTVGAIYANYMAIMSAAMLCVWNIFFVNSHTRKQEESDKLEMLRALPVGKLANITSTLIIAFIVNFIICLLIVIGFYTLKPEGMELNSIINFSISINLIGLLFACLTALFSEISSSSSTTNILAFLSLFVFYMIRAIGDVTNESISVISPLGLVSKARSFEADNHFPIGILILEICIVVGLAYYFAINRDIKSGLIADKKGKEKLNPFINGIGTFTLKSLGKQIIIWSIVVFTFAGMYGSVLGDLEGYINSSEMIKNLLQFDPNFSLTEQFLSILMIIMSIISTIPILLFTNKIVVDEKKALSEEILTKPVSRYRYIASHIGISVFMTFVLQICVSFGFWYVGKMFLDTLPNLQTFIISSFNYIPAMLVYLWISVLLIGVLPKYYWISYIYLGYSFFAVYFGKLLEMPDFVTKSSPFGIIPAYSLEEMNYLTLAIFTVVFILLTTIGMISYRKRDLIN